MEVSYNVWHGCHKKSEGCLHCYVYRRDESVGRPTNVVTKNSDIRMPIRKNRKGELKYPSGTIFDLCFTSDFFVEEADEWRKEVLDIIKLRSDCSFFCITKRPERIKECIPDLMNYPNLAIYCTCENQKRFDERAPIYLNLDLVKKGIMIEPMLEYVDVSAYIGKIDIVGVGGESGPDARIIDFEWVKKVRETCKKAHVEFYFHQTGANILVDNILYKIPRKDQHSQAKKAFKD